MRIFTYKLAKYLSTGDVAGLQNVLFRDSCRLGLVVCSGILGSTLVLHSQGIKKTERMVLTSPRPLSQNYRVVE